MWHEFKKDLFSYYSKKRVNGVMRIGHYKYSFFPLAVVQWNRLASSTVMLPDSLQCGDQVS